MLSLGGEEIGWVSRWRVCENTLTVCFSMCGESAREASRWRSAKALRWFHFPWLDLFAFRECVLPRAQGGGDANI